MVPTTGLSLHLPRMKIVATHTVTTTEPTHKNWESGAFNFLFINSYKLFSADLASVPLTQKKQTLLQKRKLRKREKYIKWGETNRQEKRLKWHNNVGLFTNGETGILESLQSHRNQPLVLT